MKNSVFIFSVLSLLMIKVNAQEFEEIIDTENNSTTFFKDNMDYQLRAYFGLGGSVPLGIPNEIKKIKSFNPGLQLGLEANATKWLKPNSLWGVRMGVAVDGRGMKTKARVEQYLTRIIQGNEQIQGYFTGLVQTKVNNTYARIPVSAVYKLSSKWNLYGGLNIAFAIDKQFEGYVSDGYLREGTPVGPKINFDKDGKAAYDFSDEVNTFQWGVHFGAEWQLRNKHFKLFPQISYTFNGVLDPNFDAISFSMHNIYLDLGFGYQF